MTILLMYAAIFAIAYFAVRAAARVVTPRRDFASLKTVTFGDETAVRPDRSASIKGDAQE